MNINNLNMLYSGPVSIYAIMSERHYYIQRTMLFRHIPSVHSLKVVMEVWYELII